LVTADAPDDFAAAILALLEDAAARAQMAEAARAFVTTTYDVDAAVARWDATIRSLTA
jgi:glycosyltransferase involved in cell wall biosynthesis